ncbi:hypothetical protein ACFL1Y_01420 [Patescibacteria group bacterium]
MNKPKIQLLLKDSYLAMIKNSVGAKMFRNFYGKINNKKKDLTLDGQYSCAFFVSFILLPFKLISEGHLTVESTMQDLKKSGWYKISKPKIGSILFWESFDFGDNDPHPHIGFYIGNKKAISNSSETHNPEIHHYTYGKYNRKIKSIWWHKKLDK